MLKKTIYLLTTLIACIVFSAFWSDETESIGKQAALGKKLFFDKILSSDFSISCSSCHNPKFAFADTIAYSAGTNGNFTERNVPSVMNVSERNAYFWDGRSLSLENQALFPIQNPKEMNLNISEAVKRLNASDSYAKLFNEVYGMNPSDSLLADALASFERTLETSGTPYDAFAKGDNNAISKSAVRGKNIFNEKGHCFDCHYGVDFTGDEYRNIGLFNAKELNDKGRFMVSTDSNDIGKFKVPGLRNVAVTAPYMHNGLFKSLRQVIDYYSNPNDFVKGSINMDAIIQKGIKLTEKEKIDLEAYLYSLTDSTFFNQIKNRGFISANSKN